MKSFKRTFALMMALVLIVAVFSGSAMAAKKPSKSRKNDAGIQNMTIGKWYTVKSGELLSIKISKDSLVSIYVNSDDNNKPIGIYLYADKEMNKYAGVVNTRNKVDKLIVNKGNYYVRVVTGYTGPQSGGSSSDGKTILGKIKIKVSNITDKKNYCPARAVSLKKNKKYTCAATPMNLYSGFWFKIKTTKEQNITVYSSDEFNYNSDCSLISTDFKTEYSMNRYDSTTYRSWDKVPAGTYYLVIGAPRRESMYAARTRTIWWK